MSCGLEVENIYIYIYIYIYIIYIIQVITLKQALIHVCHPLPETLFVSLLNV